MKENVKMLPLVSPIYYLVSNERYLHTLLSISLCLLSFFLSLSLFVSGLYALSFKFTCSRDIVKHSSEAGLIPAYIYFM